MLRDAALDGHTNVQYSIINFSEIKLHKDKRLDAGHYHPYHLESLRKFENKSQPLSEFIIHISGGATPLGAEYPEEGIPFLRVQNIMPNYISDPDIKYLSPSQNQEILRSQLKKDDVLLTITGVSYGKSAVVTDEFVGANINQHSVKMTVKNIVPYFLSTFLNCKYGYSQSTRHVVGITRPALDYSAIKSFSIPDFSGGFQEIIASYCHQAEKSREDSKQCYNEAQILLLAELGLADWQPKHQLTFVKNFSDTESTGRIDAGYFQPKYDEIVNAIKSYVGGWDTLGNLAALKKCVEVGSKEYIESGIPFVRVSNLSPYEITQEKYISEELYVELTEHQPKQGEILFSKDATPGIAYYLREVPEKMIPAGGILRLESKTDKIGNEYLTLVLNSILTQEQVKRDVGGSVILHWRPDQVAGTVIPILHQEKQAEIEQKVLESFNLRKRAKSLLECAKCAVEKAIEQNEQTAIDWLESVSQTP
ncbi:MAG: restriction endonuclease subunit S [Candidatus Poribacteria bacterium]|nr:restriction endonuclease subunit S [Candidatus Poribacteria bacterium]